MILISILVFILVFGLLVFVHELGHFFAAKRAGVKVEEFGFGYPPRIFGIKRGETIYSLNLIPLGGFVRMLGQDDFSVKESLKEAKNPRNFNHQPIWKRIIILCAGVGMNFIFAWLLIVIGFSVGMPVLADGLDRFKGAEIKDNILVMEVSKQSPAESAGLEVGDYLLKINQQLIISKEFLQDYNQKHKGEKVALEIERGRDHYLVEAKLRETTAEDEGPLGVGIEESKVVRYPWYKAIWVGTRETFYLTGLVCKALFNFFKEIFISFRISEEAAGPVGIARMSGDVADLGFIYLLQFVALLSLNLAIINIIPFPALDGGRVLFLGIEKLRGKPISLKVENIIHLVGFALLIILIIAVTYKDIIRIF